MSIDAFTFAVQFHGGLAQLARALAWHARGRRFDPDTLHKIYPTIVGFFVCYVFCLYYIFFYLGQILYW